MPAGRPRTSADPHADRFRTLGDAELRSDAVSLLPARRGWSTDTRAAYATYGRSEAAKALRAEDVLQARRLFDYLDRLGTFWEAVPLDPGEARDALLSIGSLQRMANDLARQLGIGPAARQALGIKTERPVGSRLDAFRKGQNAAR